MPKTVDTAVVLVQVSTDTMLHTVDTESDGCCDAGQFIGGASETAAAVAYAVTALT